jgi:DNA polymerase III alpha subunit
MAPEDTPVAVAGEVTAVKEWIDKKGETMAFVDLAYGPNHYSCTIFSHLYGEFAELIASRRPLLVTGEKSTHNGRVSIKVKGLPPDADGKVVDCHHGLRRLRRADRRSGGAPRRGLGLPGGPGRGWRLDRPSC